MGAEREIEGGRWREREAAAVVLKDDDVDNDDNDDNDDERG